MTKINFKLYTEESEEMIITILIKLGAKIKQIGYQEYLIDMKNEEIAKVVNFFHELDAVSFTID